MAWRPSPRWGGTVASRAAARTGTTTRTSTGRTVAVTRPRAEGGTITVTTGGQVTERDVKGKLIERYQAPTESARQFVSTQSKVIRQQLERQKTAQMAVEFRRPYEEQLRKQIGISQAAPLLKPITDARGRIIGIRDSRLRQSYRVVPGSITKKDLELIEGSISLNKERRRKNLETLVKKTKQKGYLDPFDIKAARKTIIGKISYKEEKARVKVLEQKGIYALKAEAEEIRTRIKKAGRGASLKDIKRLGRIEKARIKAIVKAVPKVVAVTAVLGGLRYVLGAATVVRDPVATARSQFRAFLPRNIVTTIKGETLRFTLDPIGVAVEYFLWSKTLGLMGRGIKHSPAGRFVTEELFIRGQPIEIRPYVRAILKSSKAQARINPTRIKSIKKVDFFKVESLTKIEAIALKKTLQQVDSVVFGSAAGKIITGKRSRLPMPKDVDIATANIRLFNQEFKVNLPRNVRGDYLLRGEKLIRKSTGTSLFDVKPLNRLIQGRSILTKRGYMPVSGYVRKITFEGKSVLPKLRRKVVVSALEIPTEKIIKVKGIKLLGFGEQTTRKGLGTLQVLIEKNIRRAKDPQSFIISLEIQLRFLKKQRRTPIIRGKIRTIDNALKILKSKEFARLLEKKVPGLIKRYPILAKINVRKLKKVKPKDIKKGVRLELKRLAAKPGLTKKEAKTFRRLSKKKKLTKKESSLLSRLRRKSRVPTRLPPTKIPTRIPTRVPSKVPTRIPTKIPSIKSVLKAPSKIPIIPTIIPISKLPSILKIRVPSKIPTRIPISKIPVIKRVPPIKPPPKILVEEQFKQLKKLTKKKIKEGTFIYIPDLYSRIYGVVASATEKRQLLVKGAVFSGISIRKKI